MTPSGRVLVIDDEPVLAGLIAELLSDRREVEVVTQGREAIRRILSGHTYDVILCDLSMPEVHGLDLHAVVARVLPDQAARFVFMSGGVADERLQQRLAALPNLTVYKPFGCDLIQQIVDDVAGARPRQLAAPEV